MPWPEHRAHHTAQLTSAVDTDPKTNTPSMPRPPERVAVTIWGPQRPCSQEGSQTWHKPGLCWSLTRASGREQRASFGSCSLMLHTHS